jgi:hypothetical protein
MAANPQPQVKKRAVKQSAWKALTAHYKAVSKLHLRQLFADDPKRGQRMAVEAVGLYLDYSKNRVTDETLKLLLQLAAESDLRQRINAIFSGEKINITEKRAVLHVALRAPKDESILVDGKNVVPEVHAVLDRMADFSNRVRSGEWKGAHRKTHSECHQHRNRRIRPWSGHGVRGAQALLGTLDGPSLCLECGRNRFRRGGAGSRSGGDTVHRLVKNLSLLSKP